MATAYGPTLLWICTLSILFQGVLNAEMARYTLATGEPIFTGFMRQRPGAGFWASVYSRLHLAQVGWPGWALAGGSAAGRAPARPRAARGGPRRWCSALGYLIFLRRGRAACSSGRRAQRALEITEWIMMAWMLGLLVGLAVRFVPGPAWTALAWSFAGRPLWEPGWIPSSFPPAMLDWALVTAFAAYSGAGGTINAMLTYWLRDKGFGMAGTVGSQPTPVGDRTILLPRERGDLPSTQRGEPRQVARVVALPRADLSYPVAAGCLIGMALPVLLALDSIPPGTQHAAASGRARSSRASSPGADWTLLWFPALLTTLWIFFSTQVGIVEGFARNVTEMLWTARRAPAPARASGPRSTTRCSRSSWWRGASR